MGDYRNIPIVEASKILDISPQMLRVGLQRGVFPFGTAIQGKGNSYGYYINNNALERYIEGEMSWR